MPVPDTTPDRKIVIRRGLITYIVDESRYDTVLILDTDGVTERTYKDLGYKIISAIENGSEVPYVKREHVNAIPGREDVAADQIAILTAADQPVPASLARAAGVPADTTDPAPDVPDDTTAAETAEASRKTPKR